MDFRQCQSPSSFASDVRKPPQTVQRIVLFSLISALILLLVFVLARSHLNTERRVALLQSELHVINHELSSLVDRLDGGQPPTPDGGPSNTLAPPSAASSSLTTTTAKLNRLEALFKEQTSELRADLQRLRHSVEALKSNALQPHDERLDYALESIGGSVEHTGNSRLVSSFVGYLLSMQSSVNAPRRIIQPTKAIGECFAFYGATGEVLLRLQQRIHVEAFSIDHIRPEMAPRGNLNTAPKQFSVYGAHQSTGKQHYFGTYEYRIGPSVWPLQVFDIPEGMRSPVAFRLVHFRFASNHGNAEYTCVYQVKVHGRPPAEV